LEGPEEIRDRNDAEEGKRFKENERKKGKRTKDEKKKQKEERR